MKDIVKYWQDMKDKKIATLFHDLLGPASSIRSFLYYVLRKKSQDVDEKTQGYLKECLAYCEELIKKLHELQRSWKTVCRDQPEKFKKNKASPKKRQ
jgi:hypothetical protein